MLYFVFIFVLTLSSNNCQGILYQLNETEYARMPALYALDPYEGCVRDPSGLYCVVDAALYADPTDPLMNMIIEYSAYTKKHFNHTQIHRGVCVTQTCAKYLEGKNLNETEDVIEVLEMCLNESLWRDYGLQVRMENIVNCDGHTEGITIDNLDIFVAVVYVVLILTNAIGTLYDMACSKSKDGGGNKYLLCFSVRRNWAMMTDPSGFGSDPRIKRLKLFQGMRTLTMVCALMFHIFILMHTMYLDNPFFIEKAYSDQSQIFFLNGMWIVQTFFVITAFLVAYNMQMYLERHKVTWIEIPKRIVLRWLRLTPSYLLVLGTVCTWFRHAGSGPLWGPLVQREVDVCRRYWWLHPLYLNNYVNDETFCMLQAWYLAADMQLFLLGLAVCVLARSSRVRRLVLWTLFIVAIIVPAVEAYILDLDASCMQTPESMRLIYAKSATFRQVHIATQFNLAPYILGLAGGFLAYRWQNEQIDLSKYKKYVLLYWFVLPLSTCMIFTGAIFYKDGYEVPLVIRIVHASLYKPFVHTLTLIGIIGAVFKYEKLFRGILEWRGWAWTGRVTYGAYLVHFMFQKGFYASLQTTIHMFDYLTLIVLFATMFMSYIAAVPLYLFVEEPLNRLVKILFRSEPKRQMNGVKNSSFQLEQTTI